MSWTGVGVNLKTGKPSAVAVGRAVERILDNPAYQTKATAMAASCAPLDALASIEESLQSMAAR